MNHILVSQQKNKEWVNRMRTEASNELKAFLENERLGIVDLVKDKWLNLKVKISSENSVGTENEVEAQQEA
jgi:hypothetical protein